MKLYKKEFLIWTQIIFFLTPILFLVNGCGDDDDNGPESPVITSLNPDSGLVGTAVDITGLNFGTNSSVVSVSFGTSSATVNSITATLINVDVPDDLSAGEVTVTVTVEGRISNEATFEVTELPVPNITSIDPTQGLPGTTITIIGTNFSDDDSENQVSFGDETVIVVSASPTEIVVEVPSDLPAGEVSVSVTVNERTSNLATFTVLVPEITNITPPTGPIGTLITIEGTNFSQEESENTVTFNDIEAGINSVTTTQIQAFVPSGIPAGIVQVGVSVNGVSSNTLPFIVLGPTVTSISPTTGPAGSQVIISGTNFSDDRANNTVSFGDTEVPIDDATPVALTVTVPDNLPPGTVNITVTVNGLDAGNIDFEVIVPVPPLYWIEQVEGESYEIIMGEVGDETTTTQVVTSVDLIRTVAVDTDTEVVYWSEDIRANRSSSIFSSADPSTSIYTTSRFVFISSIAVDTQNDRIYWIEGDDFSFAQIWRSDLNGGNVEQLFSMESYETLLSLELDVVNGNLYFIEDFDDPVNNVTSRVYEADLNTSGALPSIIYEQVEDLPSGSGVTGFVDLAVNGSSLYIAGTTRSSNTVNQLLVGNLSNTSNGLSVVYQSNPGSSDDPMPEILGLTVDREFNYLYWINYGDRSGPTNSTNGSIYRGPADASLTPELLFSGLNLPDNLVTNPINNGRSKSQPRRVKIDLTF